MKLSEIRGERMFDVLADVIDPIVSIATDDEVTLFKREACPEGVSAEDFVLSKVRRSVPVLLRKHKSDIVAIMASLEGVEPDEYMESLTMASLIRDITELLADEEFKAFFS